MEKKIRERRKERRLNHPFYAVAESEPFDILARNRNGTEGGKRLEQKFPSVKRKKKNPVPSIDNLPKHVYNTNTATSNTEHLKTTPRIFVKYHLGSKQFSFQNQRFQTSLGGV